MNLRWLLLVCLVLGCSGGSPDRLPERQADRPPGAADEGLLQLLPAGLEGVIDVDVPSLRTLPEASRVVAVLPASVRRALELFSEDPLFGLDSVSVGLVGLGSQQVDAVTIARGRLERERLLARFHEDFAQARPTEYHRIVLLEADSEGQPGSRAVALLTSRTAVAGSRAAVRQVVDNYRGEGDSAASQRELVLALGKAPGARQGRPAVLVALLPPPALRTRLREAGWGELGADASYISAALAVGDGADLGVVAGYQELRVARDVAGQLKLRVEALRRRPVLRALGLDLLLGSVIIIGALAGPARKEPEVHIAFRVPEPDLRSLLERLEHMSPAQP